MDQGGLRSVSVTAEQCLSQCNGVLEASIRQLLVALHERPNNIEVTLQEGCDDLVLVLVDFVSVEVLVLGKDVLDVVLHAKVRED